MEDIFRDRMMLKWFPLYWWSVGYFTGIIDSYFGHQTSQDNEVFYDTNDEFGWI